MTTKERDQLESVRSHDVNKNRIIDPGIAFLIKELSDEETFSLVCRALANTDHEVAIGAALVLGHMKNNQAIPYLLRALLTTDERRAQAVMWSLGEIGDETAIPFLLNALDAGFVPKSAILALGKIGSFQAVDALLRALNDSEETVRLLAVKALGQIRFAGNNGLVAKATNSLSVQMSCESSRRVKLLLAVVKGRLERSLEQ
jgi:HEAT repeat protein